MPDYDSCKPYKFSFTETALVNYRILQYAYIFLTIATLLTNIPVLYTFYKLSYYKTSYHKFLITLLIADLISALITYPLQIYRNYVSTNYQIVDCTSLTWFRMLTCILLIMSLSTVVLINADQYLKIVQPFLQCSSTKTTFLILGLVWSLYIIGTVLVFQVNRGALPLNIYYGLTIVIILTVYITLCWSQYKISRECSLIIARDNTQEAKMNLKTAKMAK